MYEKLSYAGWPNCIRLRNKQVELIATTDVGPRIIRFGFVGASNILHEAPEQLGKFGGDEWRSYGGHRLWRAPEDIHLTYAPDNGPVAQTWDGRVLRLTQPTDAAGLEKEIEIVLDPELNRVELVHRIANRNRHPVELAAWAVTVMAPGGRAIFPREPYVPHPESLLPVRSMALWSYTDMNDPRWTWGTEYIQLRQDSNAKIPQKFGLRNTLGWGAYILGDTAFLKLFAFDSGARYPDLNTNCEAFTNHAMLEVETLGPVTSLEPGKSLEHKEQWILARVNATADEFSISKELIPLIKGEKAGR